MTAEIPASPGLSLSGTPMSAALKDIRNLSRRMVGHFVDHVALCGTMPGDALRGDITQVTGTCLELAISMLDGRDIPEKTERLRGAAAQWAREGVPIDTIQHAIHEGFKIGFDLVVSGAMARFRSDNSDELAVFTLSSEDLGNLIDGAKLVVEMLDTMTSVVSVGYFKELRAVVGQHHTAAHTLTSALLSGQPSGNIAREYGIDIAESYAIIAAFIGKHPDESDPQVDGKVVARRKLRRTQAELAIRWGDSALSLLSVDGGTILLPRHRATDADLSELIAQLAEAAGADITATVVTDVPENIPAGAAQAHELLDMVQRLELQPGLHRFDDLALEYQLTRPGPGRKHLAALLDPLDEHLELLETLRTYISHNHNRRRSARVLYVHANTLDYRLKRIFQLTGFDPAQSAGLWYLRSALVARSYRGTGFRGQATAYG
ncbi:helix-turn-helix domain-containing protein [Nocardia sp. NPDC050712]|uniref:PucR family transcriptional regulator n=1 Tax=Nocardia sp. NPDC050712 TaxID=3155518 RepID=UPI0033C01098